MFEQYKIGRLILYISPSFVHHNYGVDEYNSILTDKRKILIKFKTIIKYGT